MLGVLVVYVWIPDDNVRFVNVRGQQFGIVWIKHALEKACIVCGVLWPHTFSTPHSALHTFLQEVEWDKFRSWAKVATETGSPLTAWISPGVVCPYWQAATYDFVLYDLTSVHEMSVDFCGCPRDVQPNSPPEEWRTQLLRACWWPAMITALNTCATFRVLRDFQIINCLGKLSAYDFLQGLEMCTNHDGLDKPPVKHHKRAKRGHNEGGIANQAGRVGDTVSGMPPARLEPASKLGEH
ncbi:hypothetical protein DFH08DRAFT_801279 [Mycena albidolilacea]|uniref:CxC2-like cysteine cluster KDZ transposase-associated domain-containing protein n=1 Tax=Mycena albidolilacea TaxID=1033008 RepID=A0AAD7AI30_9AGAR|nr:hypothetical protein DFH08DRAFT_801279 [Mycena albidolilacea]